MAHGEGHPGRGERVSAFRPVGGSEVTFTRELEDADLPIQGNVMASGDDTEDREAEDWAEEQLRLAASMMGVES